MSDSDTGETSRFKIKQIEPVRGTTNSGNNSQDDDN